MRTGEILDEGLRFHQLGQLVEAENRYHQALAREPQQPALCSTITIGSSSNSTFIPAWFDQTI